MSYGVVNGTQPEYSKLRCPKCGNTKEFREFSLRETRQPFVAPKTENDDPDWDTYELTENGPDFPQTIECVKCDTEVWNAKATCEACTKETDEHKTLCSSCLALPEGELKAKLFARRMETPE